MDWVKRKFTKDDMTEPFIQRILGCIHDGESLTIQILTVYENVNREEGIHIEYLSDDIDDLNIDLVKWMYLPEI